MRAYNKQTGRPIIGYRETCYYSVEDPEDANSFSLTDNDPELCIPDCRGEIFKSDEIIYWDDQGNECERDGLKLVDEGDATETVPDSAPDPAFDLMLDRVTDLAFESGVNGDTHYTPAFSKARHAVKAYVRKLKTHREGELAVLAQMLTEPAWSDQERVANALRYVSYHSKMGRT
jgi:hypothetical protein